MSWKGRRSELETATILNYTSITAGEGYQIKIKIKTKTKKLNELCLYV